MNLRLMLDGERGQVRVGRQIRSGAERVKQAEENPGVTVPRMQDADVRPAKPRSNVPTRLSSRPGIGEDLSAGRDSDEPENADPGQSYLTIAIQ